MPEGLEWPSTQPEDDAIMYTTLKSLAFRDANMLSFAHQAFAARQSLKATAFHARDI